MKNRFLGMTIIFMLCITFTGLYYVGQNKNIASKYLEEQMSLDNQIKANQKSIDELNTNLEYQASREFIEKTAREKLGFVMKDEIIFIEN